MTLKGYKEIKAALEAGAYNAADKAEEKSFMMAKLNAFEANAASIKGLSAGVK